MITTIVREEDKEITWTLEKCDMSWRADRAEGLVSQWQGCRHVGASFRRSVSECWCGLAAVSTTSLVPGCLWAPVSEWVGGPLPCLRSLHSSIHPPMRLAVPPFSRWRGLSLLRLPHPSCYLPCFPRLTSGLLADGLPSAPPPWLAANVSWSETFRRLTLIVRRLPDVFRTRSSSVALSPQPLRLQLYTSCLLVVLGGWRWWQSGCSPQVERYSFSSCLCPCVMRTPVCETLICFLLPLGLVHCVISSSRQQSPPVALSLPAAHRCAVKLHRHTW